MLVLSASPKNLAAKYFLDIKAELNPKAATLDL